MLNMDIIPIYHAIRFIAGIFKYNSASILNLAGSGRCLVLIYFTFKAPYILLLFNITMPDIYCIKKQIVSPEATKSQCISKMYKFGCIIL